MKFEVGQKVNAPGIRAGEIISSHTSRPMFKDGKVVRDRNGDPVMESSEPHYYVKVGHTSVTRYLPEGQLSAVEET